jgi:hypothetical protein
MDDASRDSSRVWGVECSDGQILWVDDEVAAQRVLTSLFGAERIVRRAGAGELPVGPSRPDQAPD